MVQIRELAVDDPEFEAWHNAIRDAHLSDREPSWWESVHAARTYFGRESSREDRRAIAAFESGSCVGGAEVTMPLDHDTETIVVELGVLSSYRRNGVGTALLSYVETLAAQHNRTILQTELYVPAGQSLDDTDGGRFALAHGLRSVNVEDRFLLELPHDAGPTEVRDGYQLVPFVDRVPDELVAEWARMRTQMDQDVPTGGLTRTPQWVDVERIREAERNFAEQGWTRLRTIALTPDGRGAGYTEIYVSRYDGDFAIQDDTFVDRQHRGRGLGARLKVANLRNLADFGARTGAHRRWVQTHTEQHNTAMQRTNEALGFRRVDVLHELEGTLRHGYGDKE